MIQSINNDAMIMNVTDQLESHTKNESMFSVRGMIAEVDDACSVPCFDPLSSSGNTWHDYDYSHTGKDNHYDLSSITKCDQAI